MANPSSSHRDRDRDRERERHHHHRTVSSTTLLLLLSLILAVLAVLLSWPSRSSSSTFPATAAGAGADAAQDNASGLWTYLSPRRSQALVAREHEVAIREAEVARREAELLAGSVAGMPFPSTSLSACLPCPTTVTPFPETVIKEIVREVETIGGGRSPSELRLEDVMSREEHVSDREKHVGKREETIGKRETDASRRENWIMEQLIALGNDPAPVTVETEEFVYDAPRNRKNTPKIAFNTVTRVEASTRTIVKGAPTETVMPQPAPTRLAPRPAPEEYVRYGEFSPGPAPTSAVEVTVDEFTAEGDGQLGPSAVERTVTVVERPRATRRVPMRSFWNW